MFKILPKKNMIKNLIFSASSSKRPSVVLPPNTIYGKVIELKKAESNSVTGTEHGIFQIENGPWEGER